MQFDFLVLGGDGMQGSTISRFLLERGYGVYSADLFSQRLSKIVPQKTKPRFKFGIVNVENETETQELIHKIKPKVVINCTEGDANLKVYRACLKEGKHVIDLGSDIPSTKKQLALNSEFKKNKLTAITGCGSTPGINNVMFRTIFPQFEEIQNIEIGFVWNSNSKSFVAPFSMGSVLYELSEKALYFEEEKLKKIDPVKSVTYRKFPRIGKQKIFLIYHPEIFTFYRFCKKNGKPPKNIHFYGGFPKHSLDVLDTLKSLGFNCNEKAIQIEDREIYPTDVLTQMLKKKKIPKFYKERERLWVTVSGKNKKGELLVEMACVVNSLPGWEKAGCNIDTAFPAAIIAEMILDGRIVNRGSFTPEEVVAPEPFFAELKKYGIKIYQNRILH